MLLNLSQARLFGIHHHVYLASGFMWYFTSLYSGRGFDPAQDSTSWPIYAQT